MVTIYIGVDDTDEAGFSMGTGKLARLLGRELEKKIPTVQCKGVLRHQLLVDPRIPYTSHNSPAGLIVTNEGALPVATLASICSNFIHGNCAPGSDPGLCIVPEDHINDTVVSFGIRAAKEVVEKCDAYGISEAIDCYLKELGGTGDGIIGALAAVGLTVYGNAGRFLEYRNRMRKLSALVSVAELRALGIEVLSVDRDAPVVAGNETVEIDGWPRPRLIGGGPVLLVMSENRRWVCFDRKNRLKSDEDSIHE